MFYELTSRTKKSESEKDKSDVWNKKQHGEPLAQTNRYQPWKIGEDNDINDAENLENKRQQHQQRIMVRLGKC